MCHFSCPQYLLVLHVKQWTDPDMVPRTHMHRLGWLFHDLLLASDWKKPSCVGDHSILGMWKLKKKKIVPQNWSNIAPNLSFHRALFLRSPQIFATDNRNICSIFDASFLPNHIRSHDSPFLTHSYHFHSMSYSVSFKLLQKPPHLSTCLLAIASPSVNSIHYPHSDLSTTQIRTCHSPSQNSSLDPHYLKNKV